MTITPAAEAVVEMAAHSLVAAEVLNTLRITNMWNGMSWSHQRQQQTECVQSAPRALTPNI
jgi:hypothetical protein